MTKIVIPVPLFFWRQLAPKGAKWRQMAPEIHKEIAFQPAFWRQMAPNGAKWRH